MTDSDIIEAFTEGDCWALAIELKRLFPHFTVCTLIDPYWYTDGVENEEDFDYMEWYHAAVYDSTRNVYYDINGMITDPHRDWSEFIWTDIYHIPDEDITEYFSDQERQFPEVSLDTGVSYVMAKVPHLLDTGSRVL